MIDNPGMRPIYREINSPGPGAEGKIWNGERAIGEWTGSLGRDWLHSPTSDNVGRNSSFWYSVCYDVGHNRL